jgi:hypothetical protein
MTRRKESNAARESSASARPSAGGAGPGKRKTGTQAQADWHAQLAEDRIGKPDPDEPGSHPVGGLSSANSASADPSVRKKGLGEPVPQVTRHV